MNTRKIFRYGLAGILGFGLGIAANSYLPISRIQQTLQERKIEFLGESPNHYKGVHESLKIETADIIREIRNYVKDHGILDKDHDRYDYEKQLADGRKLVINYWDFTNASARILDVGVYGSKDAPVSYFVDCRLNGSVTDFYMDPNDLMLDHISFSLINSSGEDRVDSTAIFFRERSKGILSETLLAIKDNTTTR